MSVKKSVIALFIVALILIVPFAVFAGPPGDPGCDPLDPACPIDGGLSLLIAAGIGVGAKKAYDARKARTKAED